MTTSSTIMFSIIIPAYGAEKFISFCLESVFRQRYPLYKYEVLVIDDKSPDNQNKVITQVINNLSTRGG